MSGTRLVQLHIERAPGLPNGLPPLELDPGLTVVLGPNASGKSTLARVVRDLLWPRELDAGDRVSSRWSSDGQDLTADLIAGRVAWTPAAPAAIPPSGVDLAALSMRSLLESGSSADSTIAQRIARELAGGSDLGAVAKQLDLSERFSPNSNLARQRESAREALREVNADARDLAGEERRLAELDAELEAARSAKDDHAACLALLAKLDAERAVAEADAELAGFPRELADLRGDEAELLADLRGQQQAKQRDRDETQRELAAIEARLATNPLGETPPDAAELDAWERRIEHLAERERRCAELREQLAASRAAEAEAARLLIGPGDGSGLAAEGLDALAAALHAQREAQARVEGARAARALWQGWAEGAQVDRSKEAEAARALRAWLRTPAAPPGGAAQAEGGLPAASWASLRLGLLLAALLAVLSAAASFVAQSPLLGVGLALVAALLLLVLVFRAGANLAGTDALDGTGGDPRAEPRRAAEASGLVDELGSGDWLAADVEAALAALEQVLGDLDKARRAADHATSAGVTLDEATAEVERLAESLAADLRAAGLAEGLAGLTALEQAGALRRLRDCQALVAAQAAAQAEARAQLAEGLTDFAAFVAAFGQDAPCDVEGARALRSDLAEQRRALLSDTQSCRRLEGELTSLDAELARLAEQLAALWERTGIEPSEPGAEAKLDRRLEALESYQAAARRLAEASSDLRLRAQACEAAGAPSHLADLTEHDGSAGSPTYAQVVTWRDADQEAAERFGDLSEQRGRIRQALDQARGAHRFADANAAAHEADERVAAERDLAAELAVARLLLDDARTGHERQHAPRLLERARERFAGFTDQRWRLELDDESNFAVRDANTKQLLGLEQLSDGTRVQLLLAARLTALEELEGAGRPLPIALDEALATSDPRRFRAIAEVLFGVADEGRQVLYLTADPAEAEQWRAAARDLGRCEPTTVDLGALCGEGADWAGVLEATPAAPPSLPDLAGPAGDGPDSFARALGVPAPDGFAEPAGWHLYLATFDDLTALVANLERRIETLGHWRAALAAGSLAPGIDAATAARIEARRTLAEVFAPLWRIGRGRPVEWADIEESGAVTTRFEDEVRALLDEHRRDPEAFLEAIRSIKGFFAKNKLRIQETLEERGCLPSVEPLDEAELVRRTLAAAPEAIATLGAPAADTYVTWLAQLVAG